MAQRSSRNAAQPPLVDRILQCGKLGFDPALPAESRLEGLGFFAEVIENSSTLSLLPVLTLLVQPDRVHSWLRTPIISALARLPLRPRGVQHTIEFILSVHPTTSGANSEQRTGRGSAISHEALNAASRLLSSPPAGMNPEDWFHGIAPQLFSLLQGEGEPEMDKAAAFVIGFGILGRRQYGAPGMPGWNAFVVPIFRCIDPTLVPHHPSSSPSSSSQDRIINLGSARILTSAQALAQAIHRLTILLSSHPNPALTKRLLRPLLLPLWALGNRHFADSETAEKLYRLPSRNLLKTLIQLSTSSAASKDARTPSPIIPEILGNLLFKGRTRTGQVGWVYAKDFGGAGVQMEEAPINQKETSTLEDFKTTDDLISAFMALLDSIPELAPEISTLFLQLFRKWISGDRNAQPQIITRLESDGDGLDLQKKLIEVKTMQKLIDTFPDKLVDNSSQVLEVASQVLSDFTSDAGNEDTASVALSLLNIVLTSPSFRPDTDIETTLSSVQSSLKTISRSRSEISTTANNLLIFLRFRSTIEEPEVASPITNQKSEDWKVYNLAISYLTTTDSPPPVRAQGLELISGLIKTNSPILDIPSLLVLLTSLLQDTEEYIYLRAVKSFIQVSEKHPKTVLKDLIDHYVDSLEEAELDQRLRLGEALLQVIQNVPLAFSGELARTVCEGLLFIAGRRGYRRKAEQSQVRKEAMKRKQNREAEEAWDGEVPQLDEVLEMESKAEDEFAAQIVGGWESKRGTEDIRVRASALSILGSAIEANVAGISSSVLSTTVDLCIHILTLEPEPEKGILRRAAILAILSFVRALDAVRQEGKTLGFGFAGQSLEDVLRILRYVEGSDNDGLVIQHAKDVIESLQAWQMNMLNPSLSDITGIQELAGLSVNPNRMQESQGRVRPRIEEIE